jgi:hypothetical protein
VASEIAHARGCEPGRQIIPAVALGAISSTRVRGSRRPGQGLVRDYLVPYRGVERPRQDSVFGRVGLPLPPSCLTHFAMVVCWSPTPVRTRSRDRCRGPHRCRSARGTPLHVRQFVDVDVQPLGDGRASAAPWSSRRVFKRSAAGRFSKVNKRGWPSGAIARCRTPGATSSSTQHQKWPLTCRNKWS